MSIALLGMFPIFLNSQLDDANRTSRQEAEKRTEKNQELQSPPDSVLRNLRNNFEKLESNMCDDEIFRTLGLAEYQKYLHNNSRFMMDGAGGNWRYFIDEQNGYSLAFRSFWGGNVECHLKLPGEKLAGGLGDHWRTKRVNAKPIKPTHSELNPQSNK